MTSKSGTLYDVCNDYSLSKAEQQDTPDATVYSPIKGCGGTLYIHRGFAELHYFAGPDGMDGVILPYED
jgi:hypothetical protein